MARVTACLRGGDPVATPVKVVDAEAFVDEQVSESGGTAELPRDRDLRLGLSHFGLAPGVIDQPALVRDYWDTVGAFYSEETRSITILDRGRDMDGAGAVLTLVHELVHAMQHESHAPSFYEQHGATFDSALALSAVIEGEAVLYEDLALLDGYGVDRDDVDFPEVFEAYQEWAYSAAREDDFPYLFAGRRVPYAFGGAFVNRAWRRGGNEGVRRLYEGLPGGTREILAGHGATAPAGDVWLENPDEVGLPLLPPTFEHVATRHLGAWLLDRFLGSRSFRDVGLRGDVLTVFRGPSAEDVTSVWRLRFDADADAEGFLPSLGSLDGLAALRDGRDVVLVGSTAAGVAESLLLEVSGWLPVDSRDWTLDDPAAPAPRQASVFPGVCPERGGPAGHTLLR